MVLSIKNGLNDVFQTRYINLCLDAFSNVSVVLYRKIDGRPNLVAEVILIECKFNSCYDCQLKVVLEREALILLIMAPD